MYTINKININYIHLTRSSVIEQNVCCASRYRYACMCFYAYLHALACMCVYSHILACVCMIIYVSMYMYVYSHTLAYMCACVCASVKLCASEWLIKIAHTFQILKINKVKMLKPIQLIQLRFVHLHSLTRNKEKDENNR